jgi:hypothetical protein
MKNKQQRQAAISFKHPFSNPFSLQFSKIPFFLQLLQALHSSLETSCSFLELRPDYCE